MGSSSPNYARDICLAISGELIGAIPVVGTPLSLTTQLLGGWYKDTKKERLWQKLHQSMTAQVKEKVEGAKADAIEKELRGFDENFNQILVDYERCSSNPDGVREIQARMAALIDRVRAFQPKLYEDELYTYATAPFLEHYFLIYVAAMVTADVIGVKSHDFITLRRQLYLDTADYLDLAISGVMGSRRADIVTYSAGSNDGIRNKDNRLSIDLSDGYNSDLKDKLYPCSHYPPAMVGAAQLMRIAIINLSLVIETDLASGGGVEGDGISADMLSKVYTRLMQEEHQKLAGRWQYDHSATLAVKSGGYTHHYKWKEVYGRLHPDHEKLAQWDWIKVHSDVANGIYGTIFNLPGGRDTPPAETYDFVTGSVLLRAENEILVGALPGHLYPDEYVRTISGKDETWCHFKVYHLGRSRYAFKAFHGKWLQLVSTGPDTLTLATRSTTQEDPWTRFYVKAYQDGTATFRSALNNKYLKLVSHGTYDQRIEASGVKEDDPTCRFKFSAV